MKLFTTTDVTVGSNDGTLTGIRAAIRLISDALGSELIRVGTPANPNGGAPTTTSTLVSSEIFALADSLQATSPIYAEVQYHVGFASNSASYPRLRLGVRLATAVSGGALVTPSTSRGGGASTSTTSASGLSGGNLVVAAGTTGFLVGYSGGSHPFALGVMRLADPGEARLVPEVLTVARGVPSGVGGSPFLALFNPVGPVDTTSVALSPYGGDTSLTADGSAYVLPGPFVSAGGRLYAMNHPEQFMLTLPGDIGVAGGVYALTFPNGVTRRYAAPPGFSTDASCNLTLSALPTAFAVE